MGRRKKASLSKSVSRAGKEAAGTLVSALSLVPGIGTAIGIVDTSRKAARTTRATAKAVKSIRKKLQPRRRKRR